MSEPSSERELIPPIWQAFSLVVLGLAVYGAYRIYTDEL